MIEKYGAMMKSHPPIFKPIFGENWDDLPKVMRKHYANRPYSDDVVTVEGVLDVMCKWYLKPFFKLLGTVPPYDEKDVPVTVHFTSRSDTDEFCFDREFRFKNNKMFSFRSRMSQVKDNEIMERMSHGICWHCHYIWDGSKVILRHKGYSLRVGKVNVPLPITWLIGRGDAEETPIDDDVFAMSVSMTHPLLGKVYGYEGRFKVVEA